MQKEETAYLFSGLVLSATIRCEPAASLFLHITQGKLLV